jgi:hypothetical protein
MSQYNYYLTENYQAYLKAMYELDERSPYTYVWDSKTNSYTRVDWETVWAERRTLWEVGAKHTFQLIKQMFDEKHENKQIV